MKKQKAFNLISVHMMKQKIKSMDISKRKCLYKDTHGNSCALGCMIPDHMYSCDMELKSFKEAIELNRNLLGYLRNKFNIHTHESFLFLDGLRKIHDTYPVDKWETSLMEFAKVNNLHTNQVLKTINEYTPKDKKFFI